MFASLTDVLGFHILNLWPGLTPPPRTFVPHDSAAPFAKHPENHSSSTLSMTKKIVKLSKGQIVNANTELIPEAPNRQAILLIGVVAVCIPIPVVQVAEPSIGCKVLCRTPPVTVVANAVVTPIVEAVPARKTSK